MNPLSLPLLFTPVYQQVVWGGRRMAQWRNDLPPGPIGESWDLADHPRGMSIVASGALCGQSLRDLTSAYGRDLVGANFAGGDFPLMIKLIDANDRLSVQVHPDDALAQELKVGPRGKTECWMMLSPGELFVGTVPGATRETFAKALSAGQLVGQLNRYVSRDGDFFFLPARTVHALGSGCLLYEVQQTCDVTFRVDDWGRIGLDGKPRPLHIAESLRTIDFSASGSGAITSPVSAHSQGGTVRQLATCPYFSVEERQTADQAGGGGLESCSIVICLSGHGRLATAAGAVPLRAMHSTLVPALAGAWTARSEDGSTLRLLVARPRWSSR